MIAGGVGTGLDPSSLGDVIARVGLGPPLVPQHALRAQRRVTDWLPPGVTNRLYFECRLQPDTAVVDLVLCADPSNRDRVLGNRFWPGPRMAATPIWRHVVELLEAWAIPPDDAYRCFHQVWLEFDVPPNPVGVPIPCVFLALPRNLPPVTASLHALSVLAPFHSLCADPRTRRCLRQTVAALPARARVDYVGLMCSRPVEGVRLCISGLKHLAMVSFLRAVGWPGALAELEDAVRRVACPSVPRPLDSIVLLHVDVGRDVLPRVGFEICFDRRHQLAGSTLERDFVERLRAVGLCSDTKAAAMLTWPGHTLVWLPHEPQPQIMVRRLNAVKLVHVPGVDLESKIYLTAFYGPRRTRASLSESACAGNVDELVEHER